MTSTTAQPRWCRTGCRGGSASFACEVGPPWMMTRAAASRPPAPRTRRSSADRRTRARCAPSRLELDRRGPPRSTPGRSAARPAARRSRTSPVVGVDDVDADAARSATPARIANRFPCARHVRHRGRERQVEPLELARRRVEHGEGVQCRARSRVHAMRPFVEEARRCAGRRPTAGSRARPRARSGARRRGRGSTSRRRSETQWSAPSGPHSGWKTASSAPPATCSPVDPRARSRGTAAAGGPRRGTRGGRPGRRAARRRSRGRCATTSRLAVRRPGTRRAR